MPLPFILAGVALAAAGYGVKKGIDALDADCEADEFIKKAESLKEEATKRLESAQSDCKLAFARFGEKKLRVLSRSVSNFLDHFHRLNRSRIIIEDINMQDIQRQVSDARKITNQLNANGIDGDSAPGVIAGCVGLGASSFTAGAILGGGLAASGLAGMAVVGGLLAAPALAILGALSADEMEKKRDDAKAYCSQVEAAVKKADVMIDNLQAVRKVVDLFTRQITKFDALFFSLSQGAIATMKKHHYDTSRYNQKENDQIATTYSTLMTLSAFLEAPIMDEHQKLNEATQSKLVFMQREMNSLETKHYDLINSTKIKFGLARRLFEFFRSFWGKNGRIQKANNS
ncbi:sortase [Helicobacter pylori]|nr:sortase [Helicobacter pylori]